VSGLILIFGRTILVGDYVDLAGVSGTVKAINIRSTTIETPERALVYVPNSSVMSSHFSNWTRLSRMVRRSLSIGVAYGSDTALVSKLLLEAAGRQAHVRKTPPPAVYFTDFGAHSLDFTLNVFIDDIDSSVSALSSIRFEMEKAFSAHGIEIPFPQLSLHMPDAALRRLEASPDSDPEPARN
jgi:small-conductance mechanosensitive channel